MSNPSLDQVAVEPAGARLDQWVHEAFFGKVIGSATCVYADGDDGSVHPDSEPNEWSCGAATRPVYQDFFPEDIEEDDHPLTKKFQGIPTYCLRPVPFYSKNIKDAFEVLEKVDSYEIMNSGKHISVSVGLGKCGEHGYADGEIAVPLAVCRATIEATIRKKELEIQND
jgi:hypothetical protein